MMAQASPLTRALLHMGANRRSLIAVISGNAAPAQILVLGFCDSQRDLEVVQKILSQVWKCPSHPLWHCLQFEPLACTVLSLALHVACMGP